MRAFLLAVVLAGFLPGQALAHWWYCDPTCQPDSVGSGTATIVDDVTGTFFTVAVDYEVFSYDNCANPKPVTGSFTYVYTVSLTDEGAVPIELQQFRVLVADVNMILEAGYITGGPGVEPACGVEIVADPGVAACFTPGSFVLGDTSLPIYLVSPYRPGDGILNVVTNFLNGETVAWVPSLLPEPAPCGSLFWKLRWLEWGWLEHYFPGTEFEQVKTRAVELSGGFYEDEAELLQALEYSGCLNAGKRAKRELSALLLNVAAGELFPGNTKCRLFLGTELDLDGDGVADSTVEEAIGSVITGIESEIWEQEYEAYVLADDINEGRVVIGAVCFN